MSTPYRNLAAFILTLAVYSSIVWPSITEMELLWRRSETFMHCYLILPIFLWLVWRRQPHLPTQVYYFSPTAALAAFASLLLWLSAYLVEVSFIAHLSIILFCQCAVWACFGKALVKALRFPLLYLFFLVPFGEAINPALQDITAYLTVIMLNSAAIPVFREGLYLHTAFGLFEVAVACSGLNFLISALALACLYAYLTYNRFIKQLIFVLLTVLLSIFANSIRAFLLIYIAKITDFNYGFGDDHYYYGWLVFFVVIVLMFWLGGYFADKTPSVDLSYSPKKDTYKPFNQIKAGITVSILTVTLFCIALIRFNLPLTEVIAAAQPSPQILLPRQQQPSDWGITFNDGLQRDMLVLDNGVEILHASYASRQDQGEMISWHNRLFDRDGWTIVRRTSLGTGWRNQAELLFLRDNRGRSRAVLYTYRIGELNLIRPELVKIAQLVDLLSMQQQGASVLAFSIADVSDDAATDILQQSYLLLGCLPESCKP